MHETHHNISEIANATKKSIMLIEKIDKICINFELNLIKLLRICRAQCRQHFQFQYPFSVSHEMQGICANPEKTRFFFCQSELTNGNAIPMHIT